MIRPSIDQALDVRTWERTVVVGDPTNEYPENWLRPANLVDVVLDHESILVVDRFDLSLNALSIMLSMRPRLTAFVMPSKDIDFEKRLRRNLKALYPFADDSPGDGPWDILTTMGKCIVTGAGGVPYDRDQILDQRPKNFA